MNLKKKQIALSNFPYYKYSLEYTLDSLERLGGGAMELYAAAPHFHIDDSGLAEVQALKKKLHNHNLFPICVTPEQCSYPINIAAENPVRRKASVETYTKVIQYAAELGAEKVQFHAGWNTVDGNYEETWKRSEESLRYLANIAEGYDVTIVMESAGPIYSILNNSGMVSEMVKKIDSPNLKGMIDTLCLPRCNEDIDTAIANIGTENLKHFHLSDCVLESSDYLHLIPGEGNMDLDHCLKAMSDINYDGYITIEMISPYEFRAEYAMSKTFNWLRERLAD